jgi:hypothetical protein
MPDNSFKRFIWPCVKCNDGEAFLSEYILYGSAVHHISVDIQITMFKKKNMLAKTRSEANLYQNCLPEI